MESVFLHMPLSIPKHLQAVGALCPKGYTASGLYITVYLGQSTDLAKNSFAVTVHPPALKHGWLGLTLSFGCFAYAKVDSVPAMNLRSSATVQLSWWGAHCIRIEGQTPPENRTSTVL